MILIQNGYIKPMDAPDLPCGDVLLQDGKIVAVGANLPVPEGAQVIDAKGRLVTPGCIDAHCHIGLDNQGIGIEGRDYNEIVDPVTPHLRAIDSINPMDEAFELGLAAGVTTVVTGPGSANVIGGTFAAIKLYGKRVDNMILRQPVAMKVAFGENPKRCYRDLKKSPQTRMGTAAVLREALFKAQRYLADKEAGKNPAFDMKLEALIPVLKKESPLKAHAHRADDIFTSIRIAKEFDVNITLDHCTDGALIADELAKEGLPAFVGPTFGGKSKVELQNKSFDTCRVLAEAGVPFAIITDAPVIPIQHLPMCAGLAVNAGLDQEEAWKAITIYPARYTGIADRVGSLCAGKDADLVIWEGNPLRDLWAKPAYVFVDGKPVHQA